MDQNRNFEKHQYYFPNDQQVKHVQQKGACLGDLKISRLVYLCKACLRLEYLGKESDSMLSEFLKGQKKIGDC
ncbi:Protein Soga1 [Manis pentadactyla]|nr:Protein Soga1 [Manis pentadactyla]